jgi:hypothetical protein
MCQSHWPHQSKPIPLLISTGTTSEVEGLEVAKQADGEPKVKKGVVGRAWWGNACREGRDYVEEGENGWHGR